MSGKENRSGENELKAVVREGRTLVSAAVIFSFLCNLLRLSGPLFILLIHDRVLTSGSRETLVVLFTLLVFFLVVMGMVDYARRRLLARFGARFQERTEELLFESAARKDFFKTRQVKPIAGLSDIDSIRGFFNSNGVIAVLDVIWAPIFLGVIFLFHWILGWVAVGGIALLIGINLIKMGFTGSRSEAASAASKEVGTLKGLIQKSRSAIRTGSMASGFRSRWIHARQSSRDHSIALKDWTSWYSVFARQTKLLLQYSVLMAGAYLVIGGETTAGAMITCMFLSVRVFVPVEQLMAEWPGIRRVRRNWGYLKNRFASTSPDADRSELWDLDAKLELANVSVKSSYTRQTLLKNINLTVEPGTVVVIKAASGSGKSLLAAAITGSVPISAGSIEFGGAKLENLSLEQTDRLIAYLPEVPALIDGTIRENISRLAFEPEQGEVIAAAKLARIHDFILSLPDGYETRIDQDSPGMSRGQRGLLALARALYLNPKILIIDEPDILVQAALHRGALAKLLRQESTALILSRNDLKWLQSYRLFTLADGRLKLARSTDKVVKMQRRKD